MCEMVRQSIDKDGNRHVSVPIKGQCLRIRNATLIQSFVSSSTNRAFNSTQAIPYLHNRVLKNN